jgi:DNA-binding NarL/FixJ family response regulator
MESARLLELGRRALEVGAWPDAYDHLTTADRSSPLLADDLERLATAAYLTGHDVESTDTWSRAHQAWLQQGEEERAVRCAFWLGFGLVQRGEMAQGGGWLSRAGRLVEEHRLDSVERGYLLLPQGLMAMGSGDPGAALERFEQAAALARRFGDDDLSALGALGRGEALLRLGRTSEGMRHLDEAMVSVTAGETSAVVAGIVYCAVIDACQHAFDLRRAREWTAALDRWCESQPGLVPYRGQCLVHRAQVLQVRGDWPAARTEVERACRVLADPPHPAIGMAHYQLGELLRLRGELDAAGESYRRAHAAGRDPQPGLALLRLAEGRPDVAATTIQAALDEAGDAVARTQLLPAYVEIMLDAERTDDARRAADELAALAAADDATLLGAVAAQAGGAVLLAEGRPKAALESLRAALRAWQEVDAPFEVARVRVLVAAACEALDVHDRAELECGTARHVFEELGASPALEQLDRLVPPTEHDLPVTPRELEVLRLVAVGRTNRAIAGELVISEKTVERHLSNIFTKLGVPNRSAATAYAHDRRLV